MQYYDRHVGAECVSTDGHSTEIRSFGGTEEEAFRSKAVMILAMLYVKTESFRFDNRPPRLVEAQEVCGAGSSKPAKLTSGGIGALRSGPDSSGTTTGGVARSTHSIGMSSVKARDTPCKLSVWHECGRLTLQRSNTARMCAVQRSRTKCRDRKAKLSKAIKGGADAPKRGLVAPGKAAASTVAHPSSSYALLPET